MIEVRDLLRSLGFKSHIEDNEYCQQTLIKVGDTYVPAITASEITDGLTSCQIIDKANKVHTETLKRNKEITERADGRTEVTLEEALKIF